jgi:hypothetical protein
MKIIKLALFSLFSALTACGQFSISVAPSQVSLKAGTQQQFLVSESDAQNPNGSWGNNCGGSIDANGMFTAPSATSDLVCSVSFGEPNGKTAFAAVNVISLVDGPATLPVSVPNSSMASTPAPGVIVQVSPGGLQTAINAANCGDVLQLQAGVSYSGAFTLPAKPCDDQHWTVIRTSAPDTSLPPEGSRINPCYAGVASLTGRPAFTCPGPAVMAKIVATKGASPLTLASGANHYRIGPGLEITRQAGDGIHYGMIAHGDFPADHIVIDRDWVHGTAQDETVRGIMLSGIVYAAVVDSYINDFHCTASIGVCIDSQAIAGGTGTQPQGTWKIEGNFLEAAAESILFGGAGGTTVPTDITIRRNYLFKPLTWMPGHAGFVGGLALSQCTSYKQPGFCPFVVKNIFELKNAQRLLFEGNVLENVWAGFSQYATAIPFQALNQTGSNNPNTTVSDITVRYNRSSHADNAFSANIVCLGCSVNPAFTGRVSFHDDVFDDLNNATWALGDIESNTAKPMQFGQCPTCAPIDGISIDHITLLMASPKTLLVLGDMATSPIKNFKLTNSVISSLPGNGVITALGAGASCAFTGNSPLVKFETCLAGYSVTGNVLIGATGTWPAGNFFPSSPSAVGFTNYNGGNGGDYHLLPGSPFAGKATDGKDPGADISKINSLIAGVN